MVMVFLKKWELQLLHKKVNKNFESDIKEDIFVNLGYRDFNWKGENLKGIFQYLKSLDCKVKLRLWLN